MSAEVLVEGEVAHSRGHAAMHVHQPFLADSRNQNGIAQCRTIFPPTF
jgi:hypothetical protein